MDMDANKDNVHYRPPTGDLDNATIRPAVANRLNVELGSHIQEKFAHCFQQVRAGYTCDACDQPLVWQHIPTRRRIWATGHVVEHEDWALLGVDAPEPILRCKPCNNRRERSKRVKRNLRFIAETEGLDSLRFITLTKKTREKTTDYAMGDDLDFMKHEMTKFSRTVEFRKHITGAHAFFECKESQGRLHTHIHIAASGKFWSQKSLERAWGGRVDIRRVRSINALSGYLAGYLSKSEPYESRRCRETFGTHRGIPRRRRDYFAEIKANWAEAYRIEGYFARWDFLVWLASHHEYQIFWMKMLSRC